MQSHSNQQPNEQADGHREVLRNDARAHLNEALQLIELSRRRLQMALGLETATAIEASILHAKRELDAERNARREVVALATRRAPDPALSSTLAEMEQTNRELGLSGDALAAEAEANR